ncbi:MAG: hypothetical protein OXG35_04390 [Acidobacteria bacterium]|nr:hypothetical protein [Acidobacteriota bacterium]
MTGDDCPCPSHGDSSLCDLVEFVVDGVAHRGYSEGGPFCDCPCHADPEPDIYDDLYVHDIIEAGR